MPSACALFFPVQGATGNWPALLIILVGCAEIKFISQGHTG